MPKSHATRRRLIALNTGENLSRDSICKLASCVDEWIVSGNSNAILGRDLGVPPTDLEKARRLVDDPGGRADAELQRARDTGVDIITLLDNSYPDLLRHLELPPPVLYCQGRLPPQPAVAIVGSRQATAIGLEIAELFGRELAACGLVVVSGFARGIDLAAHRGALSVSNGQTVAVLGCGLDFDYPRRRRRIRLAVSKQGALLSEFPLGARPAPMNFPIRNRIIAALSIGTLVVQGTPKSGSLITARLALDLGRDVYAVPGSIFENRSAGPNSLIRDGALLVQRPQEILESLPIGVRESLTDQTELELSPTPEGPAGQLLSELSPGRLVTADDLASTSGIPIDRIHSLLLELEMTDHITRLPGALFCRRP